MTNAWISHVKKWAKKNNKSYACAVSDPDFKNSYNKTKINNLNKPKINNLEYDLKLEREIKLKQKANKLEYDLKLEHEIKKKQKEIKLKQKEIKPKKETKKETKKEIKKREDEIKKQIILDDMSKKKLVFEQEQAEYKKKMKAMSDYYGYKNVTQADIDLKYPPSKKELEKRAARAIKQEQKRAANALKPVKPIKVPTLRMLENLKKKQEMTAGEYLKLKTERYIKNQKRKDLREEKEKQEKKKTIEIIV